MRPNEIKSLPQEFPRRICGDEKNTWTCVYSLNQNRERASGSEDNLVAAIRRGADLRIYTEFRHNEHIDTSSNNSELIREVADFRITFLLDNRWVAGIINLRQPVSLPDGFGPCPSMSFFLYNQNGQQSVARPILERDAGNDRLPPMRGQGSMPKFHEQESSDSSTNAPSYNFVYDFDIYHFWVNDTWTEKLVQNSDGSVLSGSIEELADDFALGREIKVGIRGLCSDLGQDPMDHEVFVHCGSCYYYTKTALFIAASHPLVRVRPAIPLLYTSKGWDFGWLVLRTDGFVARWLVNPYTLKFHKSSGQYPIRWFVR